VSIHILQGKFKSTTEYYPMNLVLLTGSASSSIIPFVLTPYCRAL